MNREQNKKLLVIAAVGIGLYFFLKKDSATAGTDPATGLPEGMKYNESGEVVYDLAKHWIPTGDLFHPFKLATDAEWAAWSAAHPGEYVEPSGSAQVIEKAQATQEYLNKKFLFFF